MAGDGFAFRRTAKNIRDMANRLRPHTRDTAPTGRHFATTDQGVYLTRWW
jgi:hypothetical protein